MNTHAEYGISILKYNRTKKAMNEIPAHDSLCIVWSSSDPEVADNLAFMYAHNSLKKQWWGQVRLIIWGPSAKLASENTHIQNRLREMMDDGVEVWTCRSCAENYGVVDKLEALGTEVVYVGAPFTKMLKTGWQHLTF